MKTVGNGGQEETEKRREREKESAIHELVFIKDPPRKTDDA